MKYTSSEAAKLLRKLNESHSALMQKESQSKEFLASVGEDVESVRPDYDYAAVQAELEALEGRIRAVKHAINLFNTTHTVPGFDMTIDQLLVYIPQLTARKAKLGYMRSVLPKTRELGRTNSSIIDYRYANYDLAAVERDYNEVTDLLSRAQTALDLLNSTETMDIEI